MDLFSISAVRELLEQHGFTFKKSLGQNFLTERRIPERIAEGCDITRDTGVIEVGPGIGTLTAELAKRAGRVVSVELDRRLLPVLDKTLAEYENIAIINGDILKVDLNEIIDRELPCDDIIACANLPYYITTPAIEKLFSCGRFSRICVMVQKEVARRICASAGSPEYGSFTVYTAFYSEAEILFDVPSGCFHPRPKVDSSVVLMRLRDEKPVPEEMEQTFFRILRAGFGQRRKTLQNGLCRELGSHLSKNDISEILEQAGLRQDIRGERLTLCEYAQLTRLIYPKLVKHDQ